MLSYLINKVTGEPFTSDDFSLDDYLDGVDSDLLVKSSAYRKELTKYDPLLFMLLYLPHLMRSEETNFQFSINDVNLLLARHALEWAAPKTVSKRDGLRRAYLTSRGASKSTTTEAMILWAACHKHVKYVYLFASTDKDAKQQFAGIRNEIAENKLILADFKTLTEPSRLKAKKIDEADSNNLYMSQSGFILEARGIGTSIVGALRHYQRPSLIIIDDMSKGAGQTGGSIVGAENQLDVLIGTILPLNTFAPVWLVGTVHFSGAVEDELLRSTLGEYFKWVEEENIEVHWVKPIVTRADGSMRSIWAEKWPLKYLLSESHKDSYQKDFLCRPVPRFAGMGFNDSDFVLNETISTYSRIIIAVDPGVSKAGDATGLAVIGFSQVHAKAVILEVIPTQNLAVDLKKQILELANLYNATDVVWEDNQGGQALPLATLGADFPLKVHTIHMSKTTGGKLERAELLLSRYRKMQVLHAKPFPSYIAEAKQFPNFQKSPNQIDAVGMGIEWLAKNAISTKPEPLKVGARRM